MSLLMSSSNINELVIFMMFKWYLNVWTCIEVLVLMTQPGKYWHEILWQRKVAYTMQCTSLMLCICACAMIMKIYPKMYYYVVFVYLLVKTYVCSFLCFSCVILLFNGSIPQFINCCHTGWAARSVKVLFSCHLGKRYQNTTSLFASLWTFGGSG